MQRSLWVDGKTWESIRFMAEREGRSISNYIKWLHSTYTGTHMLENTGKTLIEVLAGSDDVRLVGLEDNDGKDGGVLSSGIAMVGEMSPGIKEESLGPMPADVTEAQLDKLAEDELAESGAPDIARVVEKMEGTAKEKVVLKLRKDIEGMVSGGVRSYSKTDQLKGKGKGAKKAAKGKTWRK